MGEYGYSFVIMVKGMAKLVKRLVLENRGKFEEDPHGVSDHGCNVLHSTKKYIKVLRVDIIY